MAVSKVQHYDVDLYKIKVKSNGLIDIDAGNIELGGHVKISGQNTFRLSNCTTTHRDTITPANGDTIYNSTTNKFQGYEAGAWVDLAGGGGGGGGGGSLSSRAVAGGSTSSLADEASGDLDLTGFKAYSLFTVTTDKAAWVRIYANAATRSADNSRGEGTDPTPDAGVIAEVITTGAQTVIISPGVIGFNLEASPTTSIPCRVTNKSGSTGAVQVTLNVLQLEA